MSRSAVRLSEVELEERRASDRERLKQAVEQLLMSDGWQQRVRARACNGLARYSVSNLCLIVLARSPRRARSRSLSACAGVPTTRTG